MKSSILVVVTLLLQLSYCCYAIERIAFVFAGSARSFVSPLLHKLIRTNLLESLCPSSSCIYDVFVRISASNNYHSGMYSKGHISPLEPGLESKIEASIEYLRPSYNVGRLILDKVEIGGEKELQQMLMNETFERKVYRNLDSRRYSMFFNRWMAYEMMLSLEKNSEIRYTWVVHSRLDMTWSTPIPSISHWTPKVYVPDSWHCDVPDTFALIPRSFSDRYFSLDLMLADGASCLGGPNFDPRQFEEPHLISLGFSALDIAKIRKMDCRIRFRGYEIVKERKTGLTWSPAGNSEYMLNRKLKQNGISHNDKTLQFQDIPTYIVRSEDEFMCFYSAPKHFIPWQKHEHAANEAVFIGCQIIESEAFKILSQSVFSLPALLALSPFLSTVTTTLSPISTATLLATSSLDSTTSLAPSLPSPIFSSDLLTYFNFTDRNFFPFRLRNRRDCMTTSFPVPSLQSKISSNSRTKLGLLESQRCLDYHREGDYMHQYWDFQLFHFWPRLKCPQPITQYLYEPNVASSPSYRYCWTVSSNNNNNNNTSSSKSSSSKSSSSKSSITSLTSAYSVEVKPCMDEVTWKQMTTSFPLSTMESSLDHIASKVLSQLFIIESHPERRVRSFLRKRSVGSSSSMEAEESNRRLSSRFDSQSSRDADKVGMKFNNNNNNNRNNYNYNNNMKMKIQSSDKINYDNDNINDNSSSNNNFTQGYSRLLLQEEVHEKRNEEDISWARLPDLFFAKIYWAANPSYCIHFPSSTGASLTMKSISLELCDHLERNSKEDSQKKERVSMLLMERAVTKGSPLRPGDSRGDYPKWS